MSRFMSTAICALFICSICSVEASAAYNVAAGKTTYDAACVTCHKTGLMGAPKLGDKAAWAPRLKQGLDVLTKKSITGFTGKVGMMMAKGGHPNLTDAQVKSAVEYMIQQSK